MPLIKLFARLPLKTSASALHKAFCAAWDVPPNVCKILVCPTVDQSFADPAETIFCDVRCKATSPSAGVRTPEIVEAACARMSDALAEHGHPGANIRVELYESSLQTTYFQPTN